MRYFPLLFLLPFIAACGNEERKNGPEQRLKSDTIVQQTAKEKKISKINFNFLCDCDSLEMWTGGIQGTNTSDSTGPYIMGQCFANKHYDLIVFWRSDTLEKVGDICKLYVRSKMKGAEFYAFEIPKKIPEHPENQFDTFDYIFPNDVKVYKRFDDGWYLIYTQKVHSFEELGRLKVNSIFKNNPPR